LRRKDRRRRKELCFKNNRVILRSNNLILRMLLSQKLNRKRIKKRAKPISQKNPKNPKKIILKQKISRTRKNRKKKSTRLIRKIKMRKRILLNNYSQALLARRNHKLKKLSQKIPQKIQHQKLKVKKTHPTQQMLRTFPQMKLLSKKKQKSPKRRKRSQPQMLLKLKNQNFQI